MLPLIYTSGIFQNCSPFFVLAWSTYRARLVHVAHCDVHIVIAGHEVSIERLAVFQFNELPGKLGLDVQWVHCWPH